MEIEFDKLGFFRKQIDDYLFVFNDGSFKQTIFQNSIEIVCYYEAIRVKIIVGKELIKQSKESFLMDLLLHQSKESIKYLLKSNATHITTQIYEPPKLKPLRK